MAGIEWVATGAIYPLVPGELVDVGPEGRTRQGPNGAAAGQEMVDYAGAGTVKLSVTRSVDGWVIVNEARSAGQQTIVHGRSASVARANEVFMAVRVPAGASRVEFHY